MELNLVVLAGRLAAPPDRRTLPSGRPAIRYLVAVRSSRPETRVDIVPITWVPVEGHLLDEDARGTPGQHAWIVGSVRRRFGGTGQRPRSSLEIVAHQVELRGTDTAEAARPPG